MDLRQITLKNVNKKTVGKDREVSFTDKDITVKVVPFSRRNDAHCEFAYAYADMRGGVPSAFKSNSDAARAYVVLFVAHTEEELQDENSDFYSVATDLRSCRILFFDDKFQKELESFFVNA